MPYTSELRLASGCSHVHHHCIPTFSNGRYGLLELLSSEWSIDRSSAPTCGQVPANKEQHYTVSAACGALLACNCTLPPTLRWTVLDVAGGVGRFTAHDVRPMVMASGRGR